MEHADFFIDRLADLVDPRGGLEAERALADLAQFAENGPDEEIREMCELELPKSRRRPEDVALQLVRERLTAAAAALMPRGDRRAFPSRTFALLKAAMHLHAQAVARFDEFANAPAPAGRIGEGYE